MFDVGCWMFDAGCSMLEIRRAVVSVYCNIAKMIDNFNPGAKPY
jgi:hypothetical protein